MRFYNTFFVFYNLFQDSIIDVSEINVFSETNRINDMRILLMSWVTFSFAREAEKVGETLGLAEMRLSLKGFLLEQWDIKVDTGDRKSVSW